MVRQLASTEINWLAGDLAEPLDWESLPAVLRFELDGDSSLPSSRKGAAGGPSYLLTNRERSTLATRTLRNAELNDLLAMWTALPLQCNPKQMTRCFQPAFELSFFHGDQLVLQAAPCWDCAGVLHESPDELLGFCVFDKASAAAQRLRSALRALFPRHTTSVEEYIEANEAAEQARKQGQRPRTPHWPVRLGPPRIEGDYDPQEFLSRASQHLYELAFCYERELDSAPAAQGELLVSLRQSAVLLGRLPMHPGNDLDSMSRPALLTAPGGPFASPHQQVEIQAQIISSTLHSPTLETCVRRVFRRYALAPFSNKPVTVTLPVCFHPTPEVCWSSSQPAAPKR